MRYKKAVFYAFISGILLILSGWRWYPVFWDELTAWLASELPEYESFIRGFFVIILILAFWSGVTVILGGIFISREHLFTGRFLILIGAGIGLITLILIFLFAVIILGLAEGLRFFFRHLLTLYGLGIIFAIFARKNAKKRRR